MAQSLTEILQSLPLLREDVYLRMQALNLGVVDQLIEGMERQLLHEYLQEERTPFPTFVLVSALSQLWVFGIYELLRTWRQRSRDVLRFADGVRSLNVQQRKARVSEQKQKVKLAAGDPERPDPVHARAFETAARDKRSARKLRAALDRSERPFRRIEALRVHLAKHEIPRVKGSFGVAPGHGGIDPTGSIYWQVDLGNNEVDLLSRRKVAEICLQLVSKRRIPLLQEPIRLKVASAPEHSYGIKRLILRLDDGTEHEAYVAWNKEVVWVPGTDEIPFDVSKVVDARYEAKREAV